MSAADWASGDRVLASNDYNYSGPTEMVDKNFPLKKAGPMAASLRIAAEHGSFIAFARWRQHVSYLIYMVPGADVSLYPKRHPDRFSRFAVITVVANTHTQTDRPYATRATSVALARI